MIVEIEGSFPFGVCDTCGYEFDSHERLEYCYFYCPKCGAKLGDELILADPERAANLQRLAVLQKEDTCGLKCDRCGAAMTNWVRDDTVCSSGGMEGGNCAICGDDLCAECNDKWTEAGECERCVDEAITFYAKTKNWLKEANLTWERFMEYFDDARQTSSSALSFYAEAREWAGYDSLTWDGVLRRIDNITKSAILLGGDRRQRCRCG